MPNLIVSGNEITDAVRLARIQGDGLSPTDGSFGIWEAATNLCLNGGLETNAAGWSAQASATISRFADDSMFGDYSLEVVASGLFDGAKYDSNDIGSSPAIPAGQRVTFTVWVRGAGTVQLNSRFFYTDASNDFDPNNRFITLGDEKQVMSINHTVTAGKTLERVIVYIRNIDPVPRTFYVDGVQIETRGGGQKQSIATPYIETAVGTASRGDARVQAPASLLNATQGWVAARMRMGWTSTEDPDGPSGAPTWFGWQNLADNNHRIRAVYSGFSNAWACQRNDGVIRAAAELPATFTSGDIVTVVYAWEATAIKVSLNGSAFVVTSHNFIPSGLDTSFDIGNFGTPKAIDSDFFWFACGGGTLTDADAATIHGYGGTDPGLSIVPGAPTAVWAASTSDYEVRPPVLSSDTIPYIGGRGAA